MTTVHRSMRLQIAVFGRANAGKSTLVNYLTGQQISITSPIAGTTTDAVEKAMEFAPVGPVLFIDTAGLDDNSELGGERIKRTIRIFERANLAILALLPGVWGEAEQQIVEEAAKHNIKLIAVVTHCDQKQPEADFLNNIRKQIPHVVTASCTLPEKRNGFIADFRAALLKNLPEDFMNTPPLLGDLIQSGDLVVMVVPLDLQAPRGRLIMPQVQAIRDVLDANAMTLVVKETAYPEVIKILQPRPKLVVCDSQVVKTVIENTPQGIDCTTFSILFSRLKGDTQIFLQGCRAIISLKDGDRILIAEACTHHPTCEDIGRVKLPNLLRKATGKQLQFDFAPGRDYPENISEYALIVHCGSCMLNRQETLWRIHCAVHAGVPITNYGMVISYCQDVLNKVLVP